MYDSKSILAQFLRTVDTLTAGGGKVSDNFVAIRNRFEQVDAIAETAAVANLSDFVLEGTGRKKLDESALDQMVTLALAEITANSEARAELKQRVAGQTLAVLKQDYKENSAEENLRRLGTYLFEAAERLADLLRECDPNLSVEKVVLIEDNDQRTAWNQAPYRNQQVEDALTALAAAADLLGVPPTRDNMFHLVVDARELDRKRPAWSIWDGNTGRGGRFSDLMKIGANIAPVESVEEFRERAAEQGRPGPIETRYVRVAIGDASGLRQIEVDPDSPDYAEQIDGTISVG